MEFFLLLFCSVVIARYLEKRMKVASIAYSVLFILVSTFYFFGSDFKLFVMAGKNMLGESDYTSIHNALKEGVLFVNFSLSAIFIIDMIVTMITVVVSTIAIIKGIKKLIQKIKISRINSFVRIKVLFESVLNPHKVHINDESNEYLVLCQLRN